ncbi:uncharacterized protein PV09_06194 [Verruconis gallopava]|uniref:DnaJ homologue subfamily C member 28 conserved domain-containing protein n=1 Tax=Verruconis gallopava TaxID=253628 RepID=A0A0D1YNU5_9PEZI|nr:uncharacterized protein PV09_06194 [Verruconis gallopava]KIW02372.1 hypothetical protein PV09_06194 [Verruconis gallopava]
MPVSPSSATFICTRCLRARARPNVLGFASKRGFANSPHHLDNGSSSTRHEEKEQGALSARLQQMSEEALESGGYGARKAIEEAGFDPELKRKLEERIAGANFKSKNASALAQAELPKSAGRGTRDIAGAAPWTGTESVEDTSLRMLHDAHKPLRVPRGSLAPRGAPVKVDTGRSRNEPSSGARLANARDRTSIYTIMKDSGMTAEEREQYRKEMKARFAPEARSIPATLQGLASLANERIEDAIARGQFKNLPRGKHIERDYQASSPFIDTTEYLMNKMIQRQDIVPPWIEKQQELISTANKFRARLRNDWKRHAARMIASKGGSLETQIQRAKAYAAAEAIINPQKKKVEQVNSVDSQGHLSQITLTGELKVSSTPGQDNANNHIEIKETSSVEKSHLAFIEDNDVDEATRAPEDNPASPVQPAPQVFRDPTWEANERSFHKLSIENLNSLCRSYNLMAPQMAQRPYYNLERELKSCFAEVAPQLADEIRERATKRKVNVEVIGHRPGSFLEQAFQAENTRVFDENLKVKGYGFRQFWKDLWNRNKDKNGVS